jgi:hypothetical protein
MGSPLQHHGLAVLVVILVAAGAGRAEAGWYFRWECTGACAPDRLTVSGVEGPYASESDCGSGRTQKGLDVNGPGSAGTTDECYDDAGGGGGGGGSPFSGVKPARLARAYVAAVYGAPWSYTYADGSTAKTGATSGFELEAAVGGERLGLIVMLGALRASGVPARPERPLEPLWAFEFAIGLHSSPFALLRRSGFELRPDLGAAFGDESRFSCTACEFSITRKSEPQSALALRLRAGLDMYLGRRRARGIALEAIYLRAKLTGDTAIDDPLGDVDTAIEAPTWLIRLSFLQRGSDYAAY